MDAITLLETQHEEVSALFEEFENSDDDAIKLDVFNQIADALAVHAAIEEQHFYPTVRARDIEDEIEDAYDEHLEIKKLLVDCMGSTASPGFDGKVAALKGAVEHHVEEEQDELFPKVRKLLGKDLLEAIGQQMDLHSEVLMAAGAPRKNLQVKIEEPSVQP